MSCAIYLHGTAQGVPTPDDGRYVVEYDPAILPGDTVHLVTTHDIHAAKHFATAPEAFECWRAVAPNMPVRPDGQPNRPLTAYTVEIRPVPPVEVPK